MNVQLWQRKSGIVSLGHTFSFFGVMQRVPKYSASFACMNSFAVAGRKGGGTGAVGVFVYTQVIIPDFICQNSNCSHHLISTVIIRPDNLINRDVRPEKVTLSSMEVYSNGILLT